MSAFNMFEEEFIQIVYLRDPCAVALGADGFFYFGGNFETGMAHQTDFEEDLKSNGSNEPDIRKRLQKKSNALAKCLCRTDDIAGLLYEKCKITIHQLEEIQCEKNKTRKNELLVNIIQKSDIDVLETFMDTLKETNQSLYRFIQKGEDFNVAHTNLLQRNYVSLIDDLDLNCGLLDDMYQRDSLSSRELDEIKSKETGHQRNQELVSTLMRKSFNCFSNFIKALKNSKQDHIAEKLNKANKLDQTAQYHGLKTSEANLNHQHLTNILKRFTVDVEFNRLPEDVQNEWEQNERNKQQFEEAKQQFMRDHHVQIRELKSTIQLLEQQLIATRDEAEMKIKTIQADQSRIKQDRDSIGIERHTLKNDLKLLRDENLQLREELRQREEDIRTADETTRTLINKLRADLYKVEKRSENVKKAHKKLKTVEADRDIIDSNIVQLRKDHQLLQDENPCLKKEEGHLNENQDVIIDTNTEEAWNACGEEMSNVTVQRRKNHGETTKQRRNYHWTRVDKVQGAPEC